ncbi:MAG: cytochrome c3 family protein [Geoalkalibacter sp.]|jgi:hypothetical protein|uniref:cytochrome c3 family protein n=1 Tax=Geoalkalibacter sp. TaxID=3041440 RepID=UPI002A994D66|nr:cytochrome c3 family protein [Thermodesulfobacteriota bacterium]
MKNLIMGLVAVAVMSLMGAATSLSAGDVPQNETEEVLSVPEEFIFEGRLGRVHFDHRQHIEWVGSCDLCHHIGGHQNCENCHDGSDPAIPRNNNALHMQCKGCHNQEGLDTGCHTCHIK